MLEETRQRLNNIEIDIEYDQEVVKLLAKEGFNEEYGARPLERHITKMIEDRLAEDILDGKLNKEEIISLSVKDEKLDFSNQSKAKKEIKEKDLVID